MIKQLMCSIKNMRNHFFVGCFLFLSSVGASESNKDVQNEKRALVFQSSAKEGTSVYLGQQSFFRKLNRALEGELIFALHPEGGLVDRQDMLQAVELSVVDGVVAQGSELVENYSTANLSSFLEEKGMVLMGRWAGDSPLLLTKDEIEKSTVELGQYKVSTTDRFGGVGLCDGREIKLMYEQRIILKERLPSDSSSVATMSAVCVAGIDGLSRALEAELGGYVYLISRSEWVFGITNQQWQRLTREQRSKIEKIVQNFSLREEKKIEEQGDVMRRMLIHAGQKIGVFSK